MKIVLTKNILLEGVRSLFKCEICYDWCSRIKITQQWWDIAKKDWDLLNGKDLPYYIAILAVLRKTTEEIWDGKQSTSINHSGLKEDTSGYATAFSENCEFAKLTSEQKDKWRGFYQTIRTFRNGSAHISDIKCMNPIYSSKIGDAEDSSQAYYRYAPYPDLKNVKNNLKTIHKFVIPAILSDVRTSSSAIPEHRINYELLHVERGPLIDLLHEKIIEVLKEVNVW